MTSVGETLRAERESQGRTIAQVADELCIMPSYVRAMEKNDIAAIPGIFFYKSFIRQYATLLGLDPQALQSALPAPPEAKEAAPLLMLPVAAPPAGPSITHLLAERFFTLNSTGWAVTGLVVVLISCSAFYEWWMRAPQQHTQVQRAAPQPTPLTPVSATRSVLQTTTETPNGPAKNVVLDVAATERTWLSITSNGREIFSGILQPSESKTLSASDGATMRIGNAAGIEVRWNGKPVGKLGTRGQVRTVHFTPQQFEIVPPAERL